MAKSLRHFHIQRVVGIGQETTFYHVYNSQLESGCLVQAATAERNGFDMRKWYCTRIWWEARKAHNEKSEFWTQNQDLNLEWLEGPTTAIENTWEYEFTSLMTELLQELGNYEKISDLTVCAMKPQKTARVSIEQNASVPRDPSRSIPDPVVIEVMIEGHPVRALLDSGSLGDFVSSILVGQLRLRKRDLISPLNVQMAAQGSQSKTNYSVEAKFNYQNIEEIRKFDIINLSGYDIILGTPWFFQHQVMVGLNPARITIGSHMSLPIKGTGVQKLASRTMKIYTKHIEEVRKSLLEYAKPICRQATEAPLPPLQALITKFH